LGDDKHPSRTPARSRSRPPRAAGGGLRGEVGPHHVDLAVSLGEAHHRDVLVVGEPRHRQPERCSDLVEDRRRRDRIEQVRGQKTHHLPTDLQIRHVGVEVDPVQALQIQRDMAVENPVDRYRGHNRQPGPRARPGPAVNHAANPLRAASDRIRCRSRPQRSRPSRPPTSAVRGWPHWMTTGLSVVVGQERAFDGLAGVVVVPDHCGQGE
jgi:hypothetical protein